MPPRLQSMLGLGLLLFVAGLPPASSWNFSSPSASLNISYFAHSSSSAKCADGTPYALYSNQHTSDRNPKRHIFFVLGGGACLGEDDCQDVFDEMPYKLSSKSWPESVQGLTILSNDKTENPHAYDYTHWLLPYCTQDAFLGTGSVDAEGLLKMGSLNLLNGLRYWLERTSGPQEELVVIGSSAGALGVLNHMESIIDAGRSAGVDKLRIVLDSPPLNVGETLGKEAGGSTLNEYVHSHVDASNHPLCFETDEEGTPCCLSTHCVLRNEALMETWSRGIRDQRLLLMSSIYDPYELSRQVESDGGSIGSHVRTIQAVEYLGGQRKQNILETVYRVNDHLARTQRSVSREEMQGSSPEVIWATTSCVMHAFMVPSTFTRETVDCEFDDIVCGDSNSLGVPVQFYRGQKMVLWSTPDLWTTECVDGMSIQSILGDLILKNSEQMIHRWDWESHSRDQHGQIVRSDAAREIGDRCHGPNCAVGLTNNVPMISPCQQFMEIEKSFEPVPRLMKWMVTAIFVMGSMLGFFIRFKPSCLDKPEKIKERGAQGISTKDDEVGKHHDVLGMKGLSVRDPYRERLLLDDVSFSLPEGKVTAICGKSGAGKTTLLRAMVGQTHKRLKVSAKQSNFDFNSVCYLRQDDNCGNIKKIHAGGLLKANSILYNASPYRLQEIEKNISQFKDTRIGDLSGGERRRLAVCSALLMKPSLIVFDEALSGLDSVSAVKLLEFIVDIAETDKCTVVMSVHAPWNDMAQQFGKLIVVEEGRVITNACADTLWPETDPQPHRRSSGIHAVLEDTTRSSALAESIRVINDEFKLSPITGSGRAEYKRPGLTKVVPVLIARLCDEFGLALMDFVRLPIIFIILAVVLSWDEGSLTQVLLATVFFFGTTFNVFRYKISQSCKIWDMHRSEVLDGRVSFSSYMIATMVYQISPALLSLLLSLAIAYGILGWRFATFIVQYIFSSLYLLVSIEIGRVLCLWFDGNYTRFCRPFSIFVILSLLFSGAIVPVSKFPEGFQWLYMTSYTFWACSGAILNQLEYGEPVGESPCTTALTCILSDNSVISRYLGYVPLTNPTKSMAALLVMYIAVILAELLTGTRTKNQFAKMTNDQDAERRICPRLHPCEMWKTRRLPKG